MLTKEELHYLKFLRKCIYLDPQGKHQNGIVQNHYLSSNDFNFFFPLHSLRGVFHAMLGADCYCSGDKEELKGYLLACMLIISRLKE